MSQKVTTIIVALILFTVLIISLASARINGITFDEIAHIGSGYSYLTQHDYRLNPEHPPLLKVLSALPLLAIDPVFNITELWSWQNYYDSGEYGQWDAGRYLLHEAGNDTDMLMLWARTPLVLLAAFFGLFLFFWGKKMGGATVGITALLLYAFDPNILGHNHLITTDIGAAAAMSVAIYFFLRFLRNSSWKNTILFGVVFGVANTVKFSLITIMPFLVIITLLWIAVQKHRLLTCYLRLLGTYVLRALAILIVMFFTIYIIYIPFSFATPRDVLVNITPIKIHGMEPKNVATRNTILALNEPHWLRPFTLYIHGVSQVFYRVAGGNRTYFLGTISSQADSRYFPTVFITKEPLTHLFFYTILLSIGLLIVIRSVHTALLLSPHKSYYISRTFFCAHFTELTLLLFILFYAIVAISSNLTIGFRHLFPILPPLYLLSASVIIGAYRKLQNKHVKRWSYAAFLLGMITMIITTLAAFPTYLAYFNPLVGGSDKGYTIVADSNADWGQESIRLKKFIDHNNIDTMRVDYFGGDNMEARLGDKMIPWWDSKRPVEPGYYAISATLLQDSLYSNKPIDESYSWTTNLTPYTVLGGSIIIYKVE